MPREWWVNKADSGAISISIDFDITAQFNGSDWDDWSQYEPHTCIGDYWVVKKDGTVNQGTVEQLATSLAWDGNLASVRGAPPRYLVQISVKADTYKGSTRYKAGWMNPGDFTPKGGASDEEVQQAAGQFGSLLRAAASGAAKQAKPVPAPERAAVGANGSAGGGGPVGPEPPPLGDENAPPGSGGPDDDELPF